MIFHDRFGGGMGRIRRSKYLTRFPVALAEISRRQLQISGGDNRMTKCNT